MGAVALVTIVSGLGAGVLIDRTDPRRVMIVGELLFIPTALAATQAETILTLTIAAAAMTLFSGAVFTAIAAFPPYLADHDAQLVKINSGLESAGMAAMMFGPAIGAAVARVSNLDAVFVLDAATSLVSVLLVLPVKVRTTEKQKRSQTSALTEIREGFVHCYSDAKLRYLILASSSMWLVLGAFRVLEALFFRDILKVSPSVLGVVISLWGSGLVCGALAVMRMPRRILSARGVAALLVLNGVAVVAYVGTDHLAVAVTGAIIWGFLLGILITAARTLIHRSSPPALIGRIAGAVAFHREVATLVPLMVLPSVAGVTGVQTPLVTAGIFLVAAGLLVGWPAATRLDKLSVSATLEPPTT
jgi:predicted MFS family arabinose efflux permease